MGSLPGRLSNCSVKMNKCEIYQSQYVVSVPLISALNIISFYPLVCLRGEVGGALCLDARANVRVSASHFGARAPRLVCRTLTSHLVLRHSNCFCIVLKIQKSMNAFALSTAYFPTVEMIETSSCGG